MPWESTYAMNYMLFKSEVSLEEKVQPTDRNNERIQNWQHQTGAPAHAGVHYQA